VPPGFGVEPEFLGEIAGGGAWVGPHVLEDGRPHIPAELLERSTLDIDHAAAALRVPADELRAARAEHQADDERGRWRTTSAQCGGCLTGSPIPDARRPDTARPDTRADRP
jgi:hypothetical protein